MSLRTRRWWFHVEHPLSAYDRTDSIAGRDRARRDVRAHRADHARSPLTRPAARGTHQSVPVSSVLRAPDRRPLPKPAYVILLA
jgi:hypothetical protein